MKNVNIKFLKAFQDLWIPASPDDVLKHLCIMLSYMFSLCYVKHVKHLRVVVHAMFVSLQVRSVCEVCVHLRQEVPASREEGDVYYELLSNRCVVSLWTQRSEVNCYHAY